MDRENLFLHIFHQSNDMIFLLEKDDPSASSLRCSKVNRTVIEKLDYTESQLLEKSLLDIIHSDFYSVCLEALESLPAKRQCDFEAVFVSKKGEMLPVEINISLANHQHWKHYLMIARDISHRKLLSRHLEQIKQQYQCLFEYHLDMVFALDTKGNITSLNSAGCKKLKYAESELMLMHYSKIICPKDQAKVEQLFKEVFQGKPREIECNIMTKMGEHKNVYVNAVPIIWDDEVHGIIAITKDLSDNKLMARLLSESEQRYQSLFDHNPDAVMSFDREGNFIDVNPAFEVLSGYSGEELQNLSFLTLISSEKLMITLANFEKTLAGQSQSFETIILHKEGHSINVKVTNIPMYLDHQIVGVYAIAKDIRQQKRAEQQIQYLAYHDSLTGLPNRRLFQERLKQAIMKAEKHRETVVLMYLDLDRFKVVNDSLGHSTGDLLLQKVSEKLVSCLHTEDAIFRLGGDEFTVLLQRVDSKEAEQLAASILEELSHPILIENKEIFITPSIGISIYPNDGKDAELLLKKADTAMYQAKRKGKNMFQFYDSFADMQSSERLRIETELRKALERQELTLQYQPQVDLISGKMIGAEALVRWNHPKLGYIPPSIFIPIAEETGLVAPIGEWILKGACLQHRKWRRIGLSPIMISVNLSIRQFYDSKLIDTILSILQETEMDPQYLILEITESMAMDVNTASTVLRELKRLGVQIAMDDFGTGYSSLNHLKNFPIDHLKIDQSFVRDITSNPNDRNIVSTIIAMADNLKLSVIAEGVETKEQLQFLRDNHCYTAQGYYFSHPLPAFEIEHLLSKHDYSLTP